MGGVARVGDQHSHGGVITTGSPDVQVDGKPVARIGDQAQCPKHGTVVITGGSASVMTDNLRTARIGDSLSCGAVITGGSPTSDCG
jgi:uncharacterized Zn-binding protein involved in type VI secretion